MIPLPQHDYAPAVKNRQRRRCGTGHRPTPGRRRLQRHRQRRPCTGHAWTMLQHALVNEPTSTPLLTCQGAVACDQGPLDPEFGPDPVPYEDIDCVGIQRGDWVRELAAHGEEAFVPLSERIDDAACPIAGIRLSGGGGGSGHFSILRVRRFLRQLNAASQYPYAMLPEVLCYWMLSSRMVMTKILVWSDCGFCHEYCQNPEIISSVKFFLYR